MPVLSELGGVSLAKRFYDAFYKAHDPRKVKAWLVSVTLVPALREMVFRSSGEDHSMKEMMTLFDRGDLRVLNFPVVLHHLPGLLPDLLLVVDP